MNLCQMRECLKVHTRGIHQSVPRDVEPEPPRAMSLYGQTQVSSFCQIGPTANHARCDQTWCKCACHADDDTLAMMYGYGM